MLLRFLVVRSSGSLCARAEFDFWLSARAGLLALERGLHTLSISCLCKTSAGGFFTLERVALERVSWRSSGYLGARAGSSLSVKVLEGKNLRSSGFPFALERVCFAVVSWRSSGHLCARACPVFVSDARASYSPLERVIRISVDSSGITLHFFISFFFKNPRSELSLPLNNFSLGIDLLLVSF